jgi:hypothetical protein
MNGKKTKCKFQQKNEKMFDLTNINMLPYNMLLPYNYILLGKNLMTLS